MIAGTVLIGGIALLLFLVYRKIKFITQQGDKTVLIMCVEFGLSLIVYLFLLYSNFAFVHASVEQPFYLGEVYESTQYVSFAAFLLPVIFFLFFMEIIVATKVFATRGRLAPELEEK